MPRGCRCMYSVQPVMAMALCWLYSRVDGIQSYRGENGGSVEVGQRGGREDRDHWCLEVRPQLQYRLIRNVHRVYARVRGRVQHIQMLGEGGLVVAWFSRSMARQLYGLIHAW